jgi:RNA polymerase sigma-70 factor (ECF subfamily)
MTEHSDEELMIMVSNNDTLAFDELLQRHKRRLFEFLYRMTWDAGEAEDTAQETFLRLWQARARYTPSAKFTTYLFRIAKNGFLDNRRKRRSRIESQSISAPDSNDLLERCASSDDAYTDIAGREIRSAIQEAVARLPEAHRIVYVLSQGQHMSYKEIAAILECPVGTVSSRKVEAVRKLRKLLEPLRDELWGRDGGVGNKR